MPKIVVIACILGFLISMSKQALAQSTILFGKQGAQYTITLGKFPKWDDMLARWRKSNKLRDDSCESGFFSYCYLQDLQHLIEELKQQNQLEQMNKINAFVNQVRYREDIRAYGVSDYWAIPKEFFDLEFGDCEDYSLTKYFALKALGFSLEQLRIVVVKDVNINVFHAILMVHYQGKNYILDNRLASVTTDRKLKHYAPIYSINEAFWWFY